MWSPGGHWSSSKCETDPAGWRRPAGPGEGPGRLHTTDRHAGHAAVGGRDTGVSLFFTGCGILRNWSKVVFTSLTHLFMRRFRPRSHWAPRVVPGGSGEWARCGCSLADPAHWWGDRPLSLGLRDVAALLVRAGSEKVPERPAMGSAGVCRAAGRWGAGARRSPMAPGGRARGLEVWTEVLPQTRGLRRPR